MNDWKASLDRYLTTEPYSDYEAWVERVWDNISDDEIPPKQWEKNEDQFWEWENKLSIKERSPEQAAKVIVRCYRRYLSR